MGGVIVGQFVYRGKMIIDNRPLSAQKTSLFRKDKDRCNMETLIDDRKIKDLFKQAIIEAIEEKKELVHDLLFEVMEDIAIVRAIQDGENSGPASRDDIFQILEGKEGSA